jgi:hypothetical protein
MKERPMLFNAPMVQAILAGQKTVTRRPVKGAAEKWLIDFTPEFVADPGNKLCPFGQPGDRLWVRETWQLHEKFTDNCVVVYRASERNSWTEFHRRFPVELSRGISEKPFQYGWRPSIHMPRWACRILLEITGVRVERLQDISRSDIRAEGLQCPPELAGDDTSPNYRDWYPAAWRDLWNSTGGDWDANPWVWVVEFKPVKP